MGKLSFITLKNENELIQNSFLRYYCDYIVLL